MHIIILYILICSCIVRKGTSFHVRNSYVLSSKQLPKMIVKLKKKLHLGPLLYCWLEPTPVI